MTQLPPALQPWSEQLSLFPDDLVPGVGPLLSRLAMLVGPMRRTGGQPTGEFEGYSGLDRRGSYERLLTTEWLLADEQPDEFLRRAAMKEHAFFAIARREPAGVDSCRVLFDAGPDQLGAPRVAQVALLVVLAKRAEAAGVKFEWGILQEPFTDLATTVTQASVLRLVQGRSTQSVTPDVMALWEAQVAPGAHDEVWIVSRQAMAGASQIAIEEVVEPGIRAIDVQVRTRGPARSAVLELPKVDDCVRLVRDPFRVAEPKPVRQDVALDGSMPPFFADKSRVWCRLKHGGYTALHTPDSPRSTPAHTVRLPPDGENRAYALGWSARKAVVITEGRGWLRTEKGLNKPYLWKVPPEASRGAFPGQAYLSWSSVFVHHANGLLVQLNCGEDEARVLADDVLACAPRQKGLAFVVGSKGKRVPPGVSVVSKGVVQTGLKLVDAADEGVFFGPPTYLDRADSGLLAARLGPETWSILGLERLTTITVPRQMRVVGLTVMRDPNNSTPVPSLIALDEPRSGIVLYPSMREPKKLLSVGAPIRHLTNSTAMPRFAFVTLDRRLQAYTAEGMKLLDATLGGGP